MNNPNEESFRKLFSFIRTTKKKNFEEKSTMICLGMPARIPVYLLMNENGDLEFFIDVFIHANVFLHYEF